MTDILDTVCRPRLKTFKVLGSLKLYSISNGKGKSGEKPLVDLLE
jgi:hypothetical protein